MKRMKMMKKSAVAVLLCLVCLLAAGCGSSSEKNIVAEARKGVVRVLAMDDEGYCCTGTAFAVGETGKESDIFVTNWHVVTQDGISPDSDLYIILSDDAVKLQYETNSQGETEGYISEINENELMPCTLLDTTTGYPDVAVIQSEEIIEGIQALPLLSAENASVSDSVYAIGFPGDADNYSVNNAGEGFLYAETDKVVTTNGTISRFTQLGSADNTNVIQHEAEINSGNSGGPLINTDGAVIGINTYGVGESFYPTSIYIDYAMDMLDSLDISYDTYHEHLKLPDWAIPVAGIVLVFLVAGLVILIVVKKNMDKQKKQIWEIQEQLKKEQEKSSAENNNPVNNNPVNNNPANNNPVNNNRIYNNPEYNIPATSATGRTNPPEPEPARKTVSIPNDSGFRLQGIRGYYAGRRFAIGQSVTIGRSRTNGLCYPDMVRKVSKTHCQLQVKDHRLYIADCGSTNGTYLDGGRKLPERQWIELKPGMNIYLGSSDEEFRVDYKGM